jgi:ATP-dependent DNA helicase RecQ
MAARDEMTGTPIYTLGYGSRSFEAVVELLAAHGIGTLVDVRSAPDSGSRPEFSREALQAALPERGVRYVFQGEALGGPCRDGEPPVPDRESYEKGLDRLRRAAVQGMRVGLLCAEQKPEECRRAKVIGASLAEMGIPVRHFDESGEPLSQAAVMGRLSVGHPAPAKTPGSPITTATVDVDGRRVLREVFGYDSFRPLQEQVIGTVLFGQDALTVMPTGGGKSLCYQLPALLFPGLTVVVSPLISLMQDQVAQLRELGIAATFLNSSLAYQAYEEEADRVRSGTIRLLYLAPETLLRPETLALLDASGVTCFAIDEAHCISSWGHDFRPEYRKLLPVRRRYPDAVCLALTATATERVRRDIQQTLGIPDRSVFVAGFDRPNLSLAARRRADGYGQVLEFLRAHPDQAGIVYCATREGVETLAARLTADGFRARAYHAGMPNDARRKHQREFSRDEVQVIVATIAFGMGINKSNVRFVLHYNLPQNLESYYQEVGRAGRDGLPADCLLLFAEADVHTMSHFIEQGAEAERAGRKARLSAVLRFARTRECRRAHLLPYFGDPAPEEPCGACDNCLAGDGEVELVDVSEPARRFLRCVQLTGQVFGAAHLIDVLRGSAAKKVLDRRHDRLESYGAGKDRSAAHWRQLADGLLERGLLEQDMQHGGLRLTPAGLEALNGAPVLLPRESEPETRAGAQTMPHDAGLFEELRALRKRLADEADVPPFVLFSDRTLVEMAARYPQSPATLLTISGVGQHKLATYGDAFLAVLRAYCEPRGLTEQAASAPAPTRSAGGRALEVGKAFAAGESIAALQERYGVKPTTIIGHLAEYQRGGGAVDAERVLEVSGLGEAERERVLGAFAVHGTDRLGPVFAALNGSITYDELHLLRIYVLAREHGV